MNLSIVIPAYNEEKRIGPTLTTYLEYFNKKKISYEIIVVLNGCKDNTREVVGKFAKKSKTLKLIDIKENIGKGGAVIEGFKKAQGDLIGFIDADASTQPDSFDDLVKKIEDSDAIIASRWIKGSIVEPKQPFARRFASRGFNYFVRILFGLKLHDTQCGAKLFKHNAIKSVIPEMGITKWAFDVDLLFKLKRKGYKIKEITTVWKDKKGTQLKIGKTIPEMFFAVIRLRLIYSPFRFMVNLYDKLPERMKFRYYVG